LELFVAFLQAFVFTILSAVFIGTAVHSHDHDDPDHGDHDLNTINSSGHQSAHT